MDNKSGHKGVSWDSPKSKWRAYRGGGPSRVELGLFSELSDAIRARHCATVDDLEITCCDELAAMRMGEALDEILDT